jgi:predicted ATP-grasp superfamily ATP-dependent carboligase
VVLIRGIEPSMRWRTFCEQILELCHSLEVSRIVLLGALLADVPYTRPLPISGTASEREGAEKYKVVPTRYDGPTGIVGVLQEACGRAELNAMSFWVHVPHYANNPPCPKATLALLHRIEDVLDLPVPMADLAEEADEWETRASSRSPGTRSRASSRSTCGGGAGPRARRPAPGSPAGRRDAPGVVGAAARPTGAGFIDHIRSKSPCFIPR